MTLWIETRKLNPVLYESDLYTCAVDEPIE